MFFYNICYIILYVLYCIVVKSSLYFEQPETYKPYSTWSTANKKKLQHMTEFHTEYQCVFREGASIRTIMKRRISHMNPPMPKAVCEEEMQNTQLDNKEVTIEYITDLKVIKLKN